MFNMERIKTLETRNFEHTNRIKEALKNAGLKIWD